MMLAEAKILALTFACCPPEDVHTLSNSNYTLSLYLRLYLAIISQMIIDFHTHIFPPDLKHKRAQFLERDQCFNALYGDPKAKIATADEVIENMDKEGIDISVVHNIGWASHELCCVTNDYILESIARYPDRLIGFCAVQPLAGDKAVSEVKRCIQGGIKGIGELRCDTQGFDLADTEIMSPIIDLAMKHQLIIGTHTSEPVGHLYPGKGAITPDILYRFLQNFPEVDVVFAHWGGGLPFYALMPEVGKAMVHSYFDTAASPFLYKDDIFTHIAAIVGVEKILFGSDFPLIRQDRIVNTINALDIPENEKEMMLGGNARRLLGLL